MFFLTSYHWRQGEEYCLLLQQVRRKKGKLPILLACVCEDESFAESVAEWFHKGALPCCRRGSAEKTAGRVQLRFLKWMGGWEENLAGEAFALLFCIGGECFYAWSGDMGIRVLNMQFGRAQVRSLTWQTEGYACGRALLEENVGLLLGTGEFYRSLPEDVLRLCLTAIDLNSQEQADRHLAEVCGEAARRGAAAAAAVFLVIKEDKSSPRQRARIFPSEKQGGAVK